MENLVHMYYKFIDDFAPQANPTYSLLYLYALRFASQGKKIPTASEMADTLRLMQSDVYNGWLFWASQGLARLDGQEVELTLLPQTEPALPADEVFSWLCTETSKAFGGDMSVQEMKTLEYIYEDVKLNPYVIHMLVTYARTSSGKPKNMGYIEKLAISWKEQGIDTPEKAEKYIKNLEEGAKLKKAREKKSPPKSKFNNATPRQRDYSELDDALFKQMFDES